MQGAPPFADGRLVTLDGWQDPPGNRWAFQHIRELIPTARISRGSGPVWRLRREERSLGGVRFSVDGERWSVRRMLDESQTDGFLVLHRGRIVAEEYRNGMQPDTPHLLMSVSKSITATVAGALAGHGVLDAEAPLVRYIPELGGTSFDGATVRQLLDMRTGTRFNEDYEDLDADVRVYEQVYLWRPRVDADIPSDALSYYGTLRNDGSTEGRSGTGRSSPTCSPGCWSGPGALGSTSSSPARCGSRWGRSSTPTSPSTVMGTPWQTGGCRLVCGTLVVSGSCGCGEGAVPAGG
jgi:hypothetical protein